MKEIEKLYKNYGIKKKPVCAFNCGRKKYDLDCTTHCQHYEDNDLYFPPFTASKQLELIKWLAINGDVCRIDAHITDKWFVENEVMTSRCFAKFEDALANVFNRFWQDLTSEEKEQVREILK